MGATGEPLYLDVCSVLKDVDHVKTIVGGRYGMGSKDTTPRQIKAVYDHLLLDDPFTSFTIGINDDVTNLSLKEDPDFTKDGVHNKVIETSDSKYAIVYVYNTDTSEVEDDIKSNLSSISDMSTKMETYYLKQYNFDVHEDAIRDEIEETEPDYLG